MIEFSIPEKLQKGDVIGILSPSAGAANLFPHRVEKAKACLEGLGYRVKFAKHALERVSYVSSPAQLRADDIHELFADKEVKAIICAIGGDHSNQVLKYIDFEIIRNNPKIFIGYSDISVLHYAFLVGAKLQTYYGPCLITQFGEFPSILPFTLEYFNRAVVSNKPIGLVTASDSWTCEILDWVKKDDLLRPRKLERSNGYEWLIPGKASGQIIGGCIPSINHLAGTPFWINPADKIFFIDIPEGHEFGKGLPLDSLDSFLADLDNLGVFKSIKALIVGRPYNYSESDRTSLRKMILKYVEGTNYPVLLNVNIGHCDPIITVPLGSIVIIDSTKNLFSIQ
jgi:muramoyltetrapeptide carboxypeptidase LdcA involved in peptidoglycan recycling